jgi:site-specific DNA-methyltransferase (adenine-specific)
MHLGDALDVYAEWPSPTTIVSDGAYGVGGFPGDPRTPADLAAWYRPHVAAWSQAAHRATTLWFWNTEIGWATVHPLLAEHGWEYVEAIIWNKGVGHIAGKVNGDTIRQFPVATEICVFYRRRLEFPTHDGPKIAKEWLRYEWQRAGLRLSQANAACGVKNSATRKYLTLDWLWYFPPPNMLERLVAFANEHGRPEGRPYFSVDGVRSVTGQEWAKFRDIWTHQHGLTNVWTHPPLNGDERYRGNGQRSAPRVHSPGKQSAVHLNQKPLEFMRRIVMASTQPGDTLWEPFGGLCTATVAAVELARDAYSAEMVSAFYDLATQRVTKAKCRVLESARAEGTKAKGVEREDPDRVARARRQRDQRLQLATAG